MTKSASQKMSSFSLLLALASLFLGCYGCEEGDVRLTNGYSNSSGRVEFCHGGEWRAVCNNGWGSDEARVVCRQLGLPTDVALAVPTFDGGSGEIFLINVQCSGLEERLEHCSHSGIVGLHNCGGHFHDTGVICDLGQGNAERCGYEDSETEPTREELERFGNCVPFVVRERKNPCDVIYTPGVDHVYVPYRRQDGILEEFLTLVENAEILHGAVPDKCLDPAIRILCHFYLPPCGNTTVFEPPTSVCMEVCNYLQELCPLEWERVAVFFEALESDGATLINCSNTGEFLDPLPYCCSDIGVDIPCTQLDDFGKMVPDPACFSSTVPDPSRQTSLTLAITVGSVCASVVVLLLVLSGIVTWTVIRKYRQREHLNTPEPPVRLNPVVNHDFPAENPVRNTEPPLAVPPRLARIGSGYIRRMNEKKLLIPRRFIHLQDYVGQGEFGIVHRATLCGWKEELIAVKTLKGTFNVNELNSMVEESLKMSNFNHFNVMRLVGVCIDGGDSPYIVMPFMTHGSLLSYLRKHRAELTIANDDNVELVTTAQKKLLSMCLQIAKGMSYLANENFVHRDLAARNCMVDNNYVIKVSDFGLTEDIYARNYFRQRNLEENGEDQVKLPVRWMALESLNDGVFTEKTDVWSFGVTCWEVFSLGKSPYTGVDPFALINYLERGERLNKPANAACSQEIYDIMKECWKELPDERPVFMELVTTISTSLQAIAGYLDLTATPLTVDVDGDIEDHSLD